MAAVSDLNLSRILEGSPQFSLEVSARSGMDSVKRERMRFRFLLNGKDMGDVSSRPVHYSAEDDRLEAWVYKQRAAVKGDKLLGVVAACVGEIVRGGSTSASERWWPVMMGSSEVGAIKFAVSARNAGRPPASEAIAEAVAAKVMAAAEQRFPKMMVLPRRTRIAEISYSVRIAKRSKYFPTTDNDDAKDVAGHVLFNHKKMDDSVVVIPLSGLSESIPVLVASEGGADGSGNVNATAVHHRLPLEIFPSPLAFGLSATTRTTTTTTTARNIQDRIDLQAQALRWFEPSELEQGDVLWTVSLVGSQDSSTASRLDLRRHLRRLYHSQLKSMAARQESLLDDWNGRLDPELDLLERSLRPFHPHGADPTLERGLALVSLHRKFSFSHSVMHSALADLSDGGVDLAEVDGAHDYLARLLRKILGLGRKRKIDKEQIPGMLRSLNFLSSDPEDAPGVAHLGAHLRRHLAGLDDPGLVGYCRDHAVPLFEFTAKSERCPESK